MATPRLIDPNFYRTVILMLQDDEEGTIGIVLNRATEETVAHHLPEWAENAIEPGLIHYGGPVEPEVAIAVGVTADGMSAGVPGLGLVDIGSDPEASSPHVKVYSGYAGWGPNQLADELEMGSWYVVQASPDDPFDHPEGMWRRVLRRQSGFLALVSTFPHDVELN